MINLNMNVQTGDILLVRGPSVGSTVIAVVARGRRRGRFSHAALYVGEGAFLESTVPAVQFLSAFRVHAEDKTRLAVLRLKTGDDGKDRETARRAALAAHHFLAHPYDLEAALLSPFGGARVTVRPYIFCSSLVALSYRCAGQPLFDNRPDHRVTPNRLLDSPKLKDVSDSTFTERTDKVDMIGLDKVPLREIAPYARAMSDVLVEANRLFKVYGVGQAKGLSDFYVMLVRSTDHPDIEQIDDGIMQVLNAARLDDFLYQRGAFREGGDALERVRREVSAPTMSIGELQQDVAQLRIRVLARRAVFAQYHEERDFHLRQRDTTGLRTFEYFAGWYDTLCLRYQSDGADMEQALSLLEDHFVRRQDGD